MSAEEVHERFRLFHRALPQVSPAEASWSSLSPRYPELPDFISRAEVHDRFRLFQHSLNDRCECNATAKIEARTDPWLKRSVCDS
eukprot:g19874.t1